MTHREEKKERGEAARLRGPLFWSATAHLLAVFSLLVLGADPAAGPFRGVVDVFLVGATGRDRAVPKRFIPRPASGKTQVPASLPPMPLPLPEVSSRAKRKQGPTAAILPHFAKEGPDPGAEVAGTSAALAGEMGSREGPGPVPGDGGKGAAPDEETKGAVIGPSGPATASPGPGRGWGKSRVGAGTALLRERIQSRIVYPEEAVRRGQQGEVLLRIRIGTGGVPKEIRIARSSGARLLDDAARRGVVRAAPLPSAPGWVEVPVHFRLR